MQSLQQSTARWRPVCEEVRSTIKLHCPRACAAAPLVSHPPAPSELAEYHYRKTVASSVVRSLFAIFSWRPKPLPIRWVHMWCSDWCPELQPRDGVQDLSFFSPVQTDLPRELTESLTRDMHPVLVSPDGSDQAQRYHPPSLSHQSPGEVFAI